MYLPDDLARAIDGGGGAESGDAPRETAATPLARPRSFRYGSLQLPYPGLFSTGTLSWTAVMPAFLNPHFTTIDSEGNAYVYVVPKQPLPPAEDSSPSSSTTPTTPMSVPESFSRAFLARCAVQTVSEHRNESLFLFHL